MERHLGFLVCGWLQEFCLLLGRSFGGYYLDAPRDEKYLNASGLPLLLNGGHALVDPNTSGVWLTGDQVIWRPSMESTGDLAAFGGIFDTFQDAIIR